MLFELKSVFMNDGETKKCSYELDITKLDVDGIFPFTTPVTVNAEAQNRASLVTLTLSCKYGFCRPCDRCGTPVEDETEVSFSHPLVQELVDERNDDYIETPDFTLELDEVVISDIILHYPQKYLCKDDCRGLCPKCGKNLNEGDCGCDRTQVDSRLEILKQLMDSRRSTVWKLNAPTLTTCPNCGELMAAHRACGNCGMYNGRQVIVKKEA